MPSWRLIWGRWGALSELASCRFCTCGLPAASALDACSAGFRRGDRRGFARGQAGDGEPARGEFQGHRQRGGCGGRFGHRRPAERAGPCGAHDISPCRAGGTGCTGRERNPGRRRDGHGRRPGRSSAPLRCSCAGSGLVRHYRALHRIERLARAHFVPGRTARPGVAVGSAVPCRARLGPAERRGVQPRRRHRRQRRYRLRARA